jgi:hypothetical protein
MTAIRKGQADGPGQIISPQLLEGGSNHMILDKTPGRTYE